MITEQDPALATNAQSLQYKYFFVGAQCAAHIQTITWCFLFHTFLAVDGNLPHPKVDRCDFSNILKKAPFRALTAKNKQRNFHEMRNGATPSCLSVDSQICGRAHSAHPYMLPIDSQICSETHGTLSLAIDVTIIEEYFFRRKFGQN